MISSFTSIVQCRLVTDCGGDSLAKIIQRIVFVRMETNTRDKVSVLIRESHWITNDRNLLNRVPRSISRIELTESNFALLTVQILTSLR